MKLLFSIIRLQFLRALCWLRIEGGDIFGDRDIDAMLRFDIKSEHGRAQPKEDSWTMLRARIAEHEQQQAAQVYQPASQQIPMKAWMPWTQFVPRLSQAVVALFLFFVIQGVGAPAFDSAPMMSDTGVAATSVIAAPIRANTAPQINRAFDVERNSIRPDNRASTAPSMSASQITAEDAIISDKSYEYEDVTRPGNSVVSNAFQLPPEDRISATKPSEPMRQPMRLEVE